MGLSYLHVVTAEGGDLYLTPHGARAGGALLPECWLERSWFEAHRERLDGSALVYALPTKLVDGTSIPLVVKYCRVGQKVPLETDLVEDVSICEFNGPFEEFALLHELRTSRRGRDEQLVTTQRPLAIYAPPERWTPAQLERFEWRIARKVQQHPGVAIDIMREYLMVYEWLPGIDAWQAQGLGMLSEREARELGERADAELRDKGFRVLDMKLPHVIVQPTGARDVLRREGEVVYGLVDFELLERTREYYQEIQSRRRAYYERRRRWLERPRVGGLAPDSKSQPWPAGRQPATIMGVRYVHGRVQSTSGMLWVVGDDPELFDFFLPERWRTALQERFIETHDTFATTSKDGLGFVWKVSRVGERVEVAAFGPAGFRALAHGFNSPFEEVSLACRLRKRGLDCITPLAIYRTGRRSRFAESRFDGSRFRSHEGLLACDGSSVLLADHHYITIWEPWAGPRSSGVPDAEATPASLAVNVAQAADRGLIDEDQAAAVTDRFRQRLQGEGVEVMRLSPAHLLVALDDEGAVVAGEDDLPAACMCNFQHLSWPQR
jgi:hypothetical protein